MDDVYISDPRKASAQVIAQKKKDKQDSLKRRNFRQYLFDLIIKTLICSALISIDFALFAEAGSYNIFDINLFPTMEVQYIFAGIVAVSLLTMFLLSFSAFMQNIVIALTFAGLVLAMFNQFALFDQNSILYGLFGSNIDASISKVFESYSDYMIAGIIAFVALILISYTSRANQIYLLGSLLLILGGIVSEAYFNPVSRNFDNKAALDETSKQEDGRNFIFLAFPNLASYSDIAGAKSKSYSVTQATSNLLGFYNLNNFTHYPNAYVGKYNNEFINLVASLNPESEKPVEENLLDNVILPGYWDFKNLDNNKLYLKESKLYDTFSKNNYNIKVFQSRGVELCRINNETVVNKCVEKINAPINLNQTLLSDLDKTILLAAQWLESTGIVTNINLPLMAASYLNPKIEPLNFASADLYTINSTKIFDLMLSDIKNSVGNNAYFAVIDLPSSTYVYNDFCALKSPYQWSGATQQPWVKNKMFTAKQQSYAEQVNCLVGSLENFIQELENAGKLKQSVIVLQGLNPTSVFMNPNKDLADFQRVGMAIYDPVKNKAETNYNLCHASDIVGGYVYNKTQCNEISDQNLTDKRRKEILAEAHKISISEQKVFNATRKFKEWYQGFAAHNRLTNNLLAKDEDTSAAPLVAEPEEKDEPEEEESIEVKTIPLMKNVQELPKEENLKSISIVAQETPEPQEPETPKVEPKVNKVEPKVNKVEPKKEPIKAVAPAPKTPAKKEVVAPKPKAPVKETVPAPTKKITAPSSTLTKPELLKEQAKKQQQTADIIKDVKDIPQETVAAKVNIEVKVLENSTEIKGIVPDSANNAEPMPLELAN